MRNLPKISLTLAIIVIASTVYAANLCTPDTSKPGPCTVPWGCDNGAGGTTPPVTPPGDAGTCPVNTVPPPTDPLAQQFNNGQTLDTAHLQPNMQASLSCLQAAVSAKGGTMSVNSAYRPPAYQQYLRDVWDAWDKLKNNTDPDCASNKAAVQAEFKRHQLLESQRPAASSPHTEGKAVDLSSSLPSATFVSLADGCGLMRPVAAQDPVHYVHK